LNVRVGENGFCCFEWLYEKKNEQKGKIATKSVVDENDERAYHYGTILPDIDSGYWLSGVQSTVARL
jgi:hypothetical protein